MNIILLGAAGFIGTNLIRKLSQNSQDTITAVDEKMTYFNHFAEGKWPNVRFVQDSLQADSDFEQLLQGQDMVYHLVSKSAPSNSNQRIASDITEGVDFTVAVLEACVACNVKKVVFLSSGGTVYGKSVQCPIDEDDPMLPISSYGIQKLAIEKLLYLYHYLHGIEYRIIRLANPYGPYQRPNGRLGAVTTFVYKALMGQAIEVYGDGNVVRDFIYIDDAVDGIIKVANADCKYAIYNLGAGVGVSLREVIDKIQVVLGRKPVVQYQQNREVDVPINYLNVSRYEREFGDSSRTSIEEGIARTAAFLKKEYNL